MVRCQFQMKVDKIGRHAGLSLQALEMFQTSTIFVTTKKQNMITADQLKDVLERGKALRGYL